MSAALAFRPDCLVNARPTLRQQHAADNVSRKFSDRFHADATRSLHAKGAATRQEMSYEENDRNKRERLPIDEIDERGLAHVVREALVVDFADASAKHKRIAEIAQAKSEKTAENWADATNTPSLLYGLRLIAHCPTLRKEVQRLCAMEADLDPDFQREFARLMHRMKRS